MPWAAPDGGVVETGVFAFTVGGSSGSSGALSAPGEGVGVAGSARFNAPAEVLLLDSGFGEESVNGAGEIELLEFVVIAEAVAVPDGLEAPGGVFFFFLWVGVDDVPAVDVTDDDVPGGLTVPLAGSWARPDGAGGGVTAIAFGAIVGIP